MAFARYSLRLVFWPVWAWEASLPDGSDQHGYALGKSAARWKARNCIRDARPPSPPERPSPQDGPDA